MPEQNTYGKITPPSEDPATATPIAAPRFLLNHWPVDAIPGAIVMLSPCQPCVPASMNVERTP